LPVRRPRKGGGGGGQPAPSKTSKPTSQTTCWRIGFCGRRSDAAHTNKSPAKGDGARWVHLCVLPYRARTVPPKRSKPTTSTPSRAVGCALRGGPAGKSPAAAGLSRGGLAELRRPANPPIQYDKWLHSAREIAEKAPPGSGAKSMRAAEKKEEETRPTPRQYHRNGCTAQEIRAATTVAARSLGAGNLAPHQGSHIKTMLRPPPERHPHPPRCLPGCRGPASHRETNTLGPHFASRGPSFHHEMLRPVAVAQESRPQQQHIP
jgi:hypothetical protein